ncbi:uncharacterized protein ARMOST_08178 [Armillaria ostoyae]|uniref:Uncharacterized protein n=1 Tax=Armillaria ostoyae TaxID=47428 RepID=A0A284R7V9_ARMOS|nr:uncharacterized protein ARMOST_08178 [Armillaria ostoyae]
MQLLYASIPSTSSSFRQILDIIISRAQIIGGDDNAETKEQAGEEQAHVPEVEAEEGQSEQKQPTTAQPNSAKKIFGTMKRPKLTARGKEMTRTTTKKNILRMLLRKDGTERAELENVQRPKQDSRRI